MGDGATAVSGNGSTVSLSLGFSGAEVAAAVTAQSARVGKTAAQMPGKLDMSTTTSSFLFEVVSEFARIDDITST